MFKKILTNMINKFFMGKFPNKKEMPDALKDLMQDSDGNQVADILENPEMAKQKIEKLKQQAKNDPKSFLKK